MTCDDVCLLVACRTMMIGANKDGWWDEVKLMHQSEDLLDFLEAWDIDGKYQFVGHFDQSVAHNKKDGRALVCLLIHTHVHTHTCTHTHTCIHACAAGCHECWDVLGGQASYVARKHRLT